MKKLFLVVSLLAIGLGVQINAADWLNTMQVIGSDKNPGTDFPEYQTRAKAKCDVQFVIPTGFKKHNVSTVLAFPSKDVYGQRQESASGCETALLSADGNCLVGLCFIDSMALPRDLMRFIRRSVGGYLGEIDEAKQEQIDLSKYMTTLSPAMAKLVANADNVYIVDYPDVVPADKCEWKHCQAICFVKKGRPAFYLNILYTDKGYAQANKYLPAALSVFSYGNKADWKWPQPKLSASSK